MMLLILTVLGVLNFVAAMHNMRNATKEEGWTRAITFSIGLFGLGAFFACVFAVILEMGAIS